MAKADPERERRVILEIELPSFYGKRSQVKSLVTRLQDILRLKVNDVNVRLISSEPTRRTKGSLKG